MYKPAISSPGYRPADAPHDAPMQACIVCGLNEDGTVNLIAFDKDANPETVLNAVCVQADEDGCPCHYSDRCPDKPEPKCPDEAEDFDGTGGIG